MAKPKTLKAVHSIRITTTPGTEKQAPQFTDISPNSAFSTETLTDDQVQELLRSGAAVEAETETAVDVDLEAEARLRQENLVQRAKDLGIKGVRSNWTEEKLTEEIAAAEKAAEDKAAQETADAGLGKVAPGEQVPTADDENVL